MVNWYSQPTDSPCTLLARYLAYPPFPYIIILVCRNKRTWVLAAVFSGLVLLLIALAYPSHTGIVSYDGGGGGGGGGMGQVLSTLTNPPSSFAKAPEPTEPEDVQFLAETCQQRNFLPPVSLAPANKTQCLIRPSREFLHYEWKGVGHNVTRSKGKVVNRPTSPLDIINSGTFKNIADVVWGMEEGVDANGRWKPYAPNFVCRPYLTMDMIPCFQPGVIIQVDIAWICEFVQTFLSHITVPFVLLTVDTDGSSPSACWSPIVHSPLLIHWYGQNCEMSQHDARLAGRFTCLPIGMSQWHNRPVYMHHAMKRLGFYRPEDPWMRTGRLTRRPHLLLVSFNPDTNPAERLPALAAAEKANISSVTVQYVGGQHEGDFYKVMSTHQFVLSPHGAGLDCHRTWEALHLGCIPVVKTSTLDSIYEGLPVLILKDWSELTTERLERAWSEFSGRTFDLSPLYVGYWERMMMRTQIFRDGSFIRYNYVSTQHHVNHGA